MWRFAAIYFISLCISAQPVSFKGSVQPILSERCQACHNDRNPSGKLSLASATTLLKGGQSGAAVKPGKPDESLLLQTTRQA
jgi:hypothetical protein